ncbi:MAG TPA: WD40 repeat domain-containing serine/threonine protein kinase [Trebonia sp.]
MAAEFAPGRAGWQRAGFAPGTLIGGYRLEERIGAGGVAVVFRATDEALGRTVALKVLAPVLTADEDFRERFIRESRAASVVDHPNIIPVYAAGEDSGVLYLAMRYVSGGDLSSVVEREGPLAPGRAASLLSPVASALDAAHEAGIVHRDVKPANILVDASPGRPDHPYLSDFGLAKRDAGTGLTSVGEFVGTAGFASPEQISGQGVGAETDQYALACVAFTVLTALLPFRHRSPEALLWAQMSQPPPLATALRPDLPPGVDEVIARALARNPLDRYPSCGAFADELCRALGAETRAGPPAVTGGRTREAPRGESGATPGLRPGHPSFPLSTPAPPPPLESSPRSRPSPRRSRGRRRTLIAAAVAVPVVAAVVLIGAHESSLPGTPGHLRAVGSVASRPAAASQKISASLSATLHDAGGTGVATVAFGPGGTLDTVDQNDTVYKFAVAARRVVSRFSLGRTIGGGALFSQDGQAIATPDSGCAGGGPASCSYEVFFFNVMEWDAKITAGPGSAVSTGDYTMAVSARRGDGVQVWNLRTLAPVADLTDPDHRPVGAIAISPDGSAVAAVGAGAPGTRQVYVWNTASQAAAAVLTVPGKLGVAWATLDTAGTAIALAGTTLSVSDGLTTNVYSDTPRSARLVATAPGGLLALDPGGGLLATTDPLSDGVIDLRDAGTGRKVATLAIPATQAGPSTVEFSPDGHSLAVGCGNGDTYVWRIAGE